MGSTRYGRPQAVEPERLAEILVLAQDTVVEGGYVDQPTQPHRGVDADPAERVDGLFDLELQQRVRQVGDLGEVLKEIGDPRLDKTGSTNS